VKYQIVMAMGNALKANVFAHRVSKVISAINSVVQAQTALIMEFASKANVFAFRIILVSVVSNYSLPFLVYVPIMEISITQRNHAHAKKAFRARIALEMTIVLTNYAVFVRMAGMDQTA